jgi:ADP-ribosylglycohydrolase
MRSAIFGIYFNNVDMIIQYSTEQAITTHFNGIAIIGSCINSIFVLFGKKRFEPSTWIFKVYELIPNIDTYVRKNYNSIYNEYLIDRNIFVAKLKFYMDDNFLQGKYKHNEIREINPVERILYWFDNFTTNKNNFFPGSASDDSIIIAYDCLLMSENNYEKLIYLSMLNLGDSDTIGMIASNFYGIYYGFENVPQNLMNDHTEFWLVKNLLKKLNHQKLKPQ